MFSLSSDLTQGIKVGLFTGESVIQFTGIRMLNGREIHNQDSSSIQLLASKLYKQ